MENQSELNQGPSPEEERRIKRRARRERLDKQRRIRNRRIKLFVLAAIVVIGAAVIFTLAQKFLPSNDQANLYDYFGLTESGDATGDTKAAIVTDTEVLSAKAIYSDGQVYIDIETVRDQLNNRFYWDSNEQILLYTTASSVIETGVGSTDYYVGNTLTEAGYTTVRYVSDTAYVALDYVKLYTDLEYEYFTDPNRVVITTVTGEVDYAQARRGAKIRVLGGIKSEILTTCEKGAILTILEEMDSWTKVRTEDGYIGYIANSRIKETYTETVSRGFTEEEYSSISRSFQINMVWDQIISYSDNSDISSTLSSESGVNVISPTWFSLENNSGDITSLASQSYVDSAHAQGVEVWALFGNIATDTSYSSTVLNTTSLREHLESQIIAAALEYKLDGINIDFENLDYDVADSYIQFIRELSILCRNNSIVLSVDITKPIYNQDYEDLAELQNVADYVVLMAYDEHYDGSGQGSVASIPWVAEFIDETLKQGVSSSKIVLGLPFYSRLWSLDKGSDEVSVTSSVLSISAQSSVLSDNGLTPAYDSTTGQNYVEYTSDGTTYMLWLEDSTSMDARLTLYTSYSLAGVSGWRAGLETTDIRSLINSYISKSE
ncbi:MAG: SH3 domain-containing protein [Eubacterium sp.]|nr:SH3 domain-containing protein [Eubacterium sp.]